MTLFEKISLLKKALYWSDGRVVGDDMNKLPAEIDEEINKQITKRTAVHPGLREMHEDYIRALRGEKMDAVDRIGLENSRRNAIRSRVSPPDAGPAFRQKLEGLQEIAASGINKLKGYSRRSRGIIRL